MHALPPSTHIIMKMKLRSFVIIIKRKFYDVPEHFFYVALQLMENGQVFEMGPCLIGEGRTKRR